MHIDVRIRLCRHGSARSREGVVGEPASDVIGVVFGFAEERGQVLVVHRVVDHVPIAPGFDQSPVRKTRSWCETADSDTPTTSATSRTHNSPARRAYEDAGTGRIGERREGLHHDGEQLIGRDSGASCLHRVGMDRRRRRVDHRRVSPLNLNMYSDSTPTLGQVSSPRTAASGGVGVRLSPALSVRRGYPRRMVTRTRRRGSLPSSTSVTSRSVQPVARRSTSARLKKWTMKPPCSYMSSPRAIPAR